MSSTSDTARTVRFGDCELDLQSGELRRNGRMTRLQEQGFRILLLLLERPGQVVTREDLRHRLWAADTFVDFDMGLNSAMKKLRDALGDSPEDPKFIETLKRRGYRFVAPIDSPAPDHVPADAAKLGSLSTPSMWTVALALAVLIGVIASVTAVRWARGAAVGAPPGRIESIAVLPLANLSGDPEHESFADSLTDALITDLAQIQGLRVISRTSVMPYKQARKRLPEIARELNVDAVVEGTVMRSGSTVRISAQLIQATNEQHLWAKSYERDVIDIFTLQGELAQAVADAVEARVMPQVRARLNSAPRVHRDANNAFFKGLVAAGGMTSANFAKAIEQFELAVTIQPDFALAHVYLARYHYQSAFTNAAPPATFMSKAEAAVRKGLEADPWLAEGHRILANILYRYHWDWPAAETAFKRALELSPSDAAAHRAYSMFLSARGRVDEAVAHKEMARKLDPNLADMNLDEPSRTPGDFERTAAAYREAVKRSPTPRGYFQLGSALVMNGQLTEGIKALEASRPNNSVRYLAYLGYAYGASGDTVKARQILKELTVRSGKQYVSSFAIALVHMGLGEKGTAIERLEQAYREHAFELSHVNLTPAFDALRPEPRFQDLARRLGLPVLSR